MRDRQELFAALERSSFRRRFHLKQGRDREYASARGPEIIRDHATRMITERLAPAQPRRDGKQTPYRGHPVFVAQHATATCCRGCLQKWHRIEKGRPLTAEEIDYVVDVISDWISGELAA